MDNVTINTEFIRLDGLLKFSGLAESGGFAKQVITGGEVMVNGKTRKERGAKIYPGDIVEYCGNVIKVLVDEGK